LPSSSAGKAGGNHTPNQLLVAALLECIKNLPPSVCRLQPQAATATWLQVSSAALGLTVSSIQHRLHQQLAGGLIQARQLICHSASASIYWHSAPPQMLLPLASAAAKTGRRLLFLPFAVAAAATAAVLAAAITALLIAATAAAAVLIAAAFLPAVFLQLLYQLPLIIFLLICHRPSIQLSIFALIIITTTILAFIIITTVCITV
jgi:hypothetical protein